ncbi:MAG: hypothetical protein HPY66_2955 [Firmicutes bacterium]|nr:hypothetical protein [Bacillota bacterium]
MKYLIILSLAGVPVLYDRLRKRPRIRRKWSVRPDTGLIRRFGKLVCRYDALNGLKTRLAGKLSVINSGSYRENEAVALWVMLAAAAAGVMSALVFFNLFAMWYTALLLSVLAGYTVLYVFDAWLNIRLAAVRKKLPAALQLFIDSYMSHKNIKAAINESYRRMDPAIGAVFERMARQLSGSHDYRRPIREFAESLDYVWAYAFSELLLTSYEGAGDISEELLFLNELMNDDLKNEEETKTELSTNRMLFIVITASTALAFILNIMFNPIAGDLYFYTPAGNVIVFVWVVVIVLGISVMTVMERI